MFDSSLVKHKSVNGPALHEPHCHSVGRAAGQVFWRMSYVGVNPLLDSYYWFARDVMGATLVVQNISILWELNSIFMQIF